MTDHTPAESNRGVPNGTPALTLRAILATLPADTLLPAGWLLDRLAVDAASDGARHETLSAQEFAALRRPRRTADWVREKCALGWFDGAFKDGGEWRIPRSSLSQHTSRGIEPSESDFTRNVAGTSGAGGSRYPRW